jgi:hypothetical protein
MKIALGIALLLSPVARAQAGDEDTGPSASFGRHQQRQRERCYGRAAGG